MEEVAKFLRELAMDEYIDAFNRAGYDKMKIVLKMNDDKLQRCGVSKPGHRDTILEAIADINKRLTAPPTPVPVPPASL